MSKCGAISNGVSFLADGTIAPCCQVKREYAVPVTEITNPNRFQNIIDNFEDACEACVQAETLPSGVTDHGALSGLADDDHTQYHNDTRGDARYYTQTQIDARNLNDVNDVTITTLGTDELLFTQDGSTWINQTLAEADIDVTVMGVTVNTVQTTNATQTTLQTIAIPTGEQKMIVARVIGNESATNDTVWRHLTLCAKNISGTVSIVGGVSSSSGSDAGASTWDITASASGATIIIQVTGEAAHTIDWTTTTEIS